MNYHKKNHQKNDLVIYAAALQDHYSRYLNKNAHILKLPRLPTKSQNVQKPLPVVKKYDLMNFPQTQETMKIHKYFNQLTLAQKLGLIPAPPQPLSLESWSLIEEQARKRKEGEGLCPICLEAFKGQDQIILSCSHMFHKTCLASLERISRVKMCPICRKLDYDKKETNQGFIYYQTRCVILIQKIIRGYLARKRFFENFIGLREKGIVSKLLKRRILAYKLKKIGKRIDKNLQIRDKASEKIIEKIEKNVQENSDSIYSGIQQLQAIELKSQENKDKVLEIVWKQYEGNIHEHNEKIKYKKEGNIQKEWTEIKRKGIERCGDDCAICLNKLFNKKPLYLLSCSHIFHIHCIEALERYSLLDKKNCPICRETYQKMKLIAN